MELHPSPWQLKAKHIAHEGLEAFLGSRALPYVVRGWWHPASCFLGCTQGCPGDAGARGWVLSLGKSLWEVSSALGRGWRGGMRQRQQLIRNQSSFPPSEEAMPGGGDDTKARNPLWDVWGRAVITSTSSPVVSSSVCPSSSNARGRELCGQAELGAALGGVGTCSKGGGGRNR